MWTVVERAFLITDTSETTAGCLQVETSKSCTQSGVTVFGSDIQEFPQSEKVRFTFDGGVAAKPSGEILESEFFSLPWATDILFL